MQGVYERLTKKEEAGMAGRQETTRGKPGRKAGENAAPSSVQVLDRSLKLLELVAGADGAGLTDLADQSGMAPSTVHRLLTSLAGHGMVTHDAETGAWTIGVKAFEIGTAYLRFRKLGTTLILVSHDRMAMLGLWQVPGAHYICIEPWAGHADPEGFAGDITQKPGIVLLAPGESRSFRMDVTVRGG